MIASPMSRRHALRNIAAGSLSVAPFLRGFAANAESKSDKPAKRFVFISTVFIPHRTGGSLLVPSDCTNCIFVRAGERKDGASLNRVASKTNRPRSQPPPQAPRPRYLTLGLKFGSTFSCFPTTEASFLLSSPFSLSSRLRDLLKIRGRN